ncbi:molybdenum ABC transporter ATP-binding protein [Sulfuriferula sp.]|uniref:molybdenum ABC transporter ATP-binding protein n=1 Tax=Sulfuriferula sp. TaxID=2025307 RepID=UPI002730089D|nr:molybdenum ABC transporter ATP-binding protein [Sulfuriferula sp.]MDP2027240.1 molybdenum ABC transporter ATP-binding protein [Sulfuriferula sp.]
MNAAIHAQFKLAYSGFTLDVDLDLPGRGVIALFGHSGSGKTALLRCIAGLERANNGFLAVNGRVWQDDSQRVYLPTYQRPLGYVFQEASLFPHLNVRRNLEYGMKRVPASERRASLEQAISLLGIGNLLTQLPDTLSGGERQRVAIAHALAVSPQLLLMDEPLAALDQARKQEILPYLEQLHGELNIPILYVSHAADEVARLADHIVVMEAGKVLANGPLSDTLSRLDLPLRLGEDTGVVIDATVGLREAQWHLQRADFVGGSVWVRDSGAAIGASVRIRILARDVSVALNRLDHTSILNQLEGKVTAIAEDDHAGQVLVRVQVGAAVLLARITRRSAADLVPGRPVWVQVKSVALMR